MLDPSRIPTVMKVLESLWCKYPHLRFMQLIQNITGPGKLCDMEDSAFFQKLVEYQQQVAEAEELGKLKEQW